MALVKVDDLSPGMVLAADLTTPQGRRLLSRGAPLAEAHIRACKIWGVVEADVAGGAARAAAEPQGIAPAEAKDTANRLAQAYFCLNDPRHPIVMEALKLFRVRATRMLVRDPAHPFAILTRTRGSLSPGTDAAPGTEPPRPALADIVSAKLSLASTPETFRRVVEAINDPACSSTRMAEVVGLDPALSSRVLRAVNSPYYGFAQKVETLPRAITLVGVGKIKSLAVGITVMSMFEDLDEDLLTMPAFWRHSIACGIVARLLAVQCGEKEEERYFVAGLIHDIGRLLMLKNQGPAARQALALSRAGREPLHVVERKTWDFTHADLAREVLASWHFPDFMIHAVGRHHDPGTGGQTREAAVIHCADFLVHALGIGISGASLVPPLDPGAWNGLKLSHNVLSVLVPQVEAQIEDALRAFTEDAP